MQHPPTLKASESGKRRIKEAIKAKGWKLDVNADDHLLQAATLLLEPQKKAFYQAQWAEGSSLVAAGVSPATRKRFQEANDRIKAEIFKAFCQVLGLDWQEIAELDISKRTVIGDLPDLSQFYGRTWYLNQLHQWIIQEHARLVIIYGQPGIGKTSLVRQFIETVRTKTAKEFEEIIWLTPSSFFPDLFSDLLSQAEASSDSIAILFELLKRPKSLIVLDRWTEILGIDGGTTRYLDEDYDSTRLLQRITRQEYTSCLILISDVRPALETNVSSVHAVRLEGLGKIRPGFHEFNDDKQILVAEGLHGEDYELSAFLTRYGNPSVLKSVAARAREVFGGNVAKFVGVQFSIFLDADFDERLDRVWNVLTKEERIVMYWLAIRRESRSFEQLAEDVAKFGVRQDELIELLFTLIGRQLLVERSENLEYSLNLVWQKFATKKLIQESAAEISRAIERDRTQNTELFLGLAFVTPDTQDERIQSEQMRRIVMPILKELLKQQDQLNLREGLERVSTSLQEYGNAGAYGIQNISALLSKLDSR